MYEIDLSNARMAAMRSTMPEDVARYVHSEYRERDAGWLLAENGHQQTVADATISVNEDDRQPARHGGRHSRIHPADSVVLDSFPAR